MDSPEFVRVPTEGNVLTHLSYSRMNRYLLCPEQYRLYYVEGLRPRVPSANLHFGKLIHESLATLFQTGEDPVDRFAESWDELRDAELKYSFRDNWDRLNEKGRSLLSKFVDEELPKIGAVDSSERAFELNFGYLDVPFIGFIDLVAEIDGRRTVVDFKTASSSFADHQVVMSDQLSAYRLAEPAAEQQALCVLVKTKEPRVEWMFGKPDDVRGAELLNKVRLVEHQIHAGWFYKRPGMWCAQCDYLGLCASNERLV